MKNMMKYISLALLFFFLGSNVQKIEAKDLFKCNYEFNFSELYGNAKNETTKFTITVTSDKNAAVDGTLKNAQGTDIFGGNTFNWINSFSSQFNTEAKKNNICPSLRFSYRDSTFIGMLSISNDTMAEVSKVVDGKISDAKVETSKEKVICTRTSTLRNQNYNIEIIFAKQGNKNVWKIKDSNNDTGYVHADVPLQDSRSNMYTINQTDISKYFNSKTCKNSKLYLNIRSEISTGIYSMTIQTKKPSNINNGAFSSNYADQDDGISDNKFNNDNNNKDNNDEDYINGCGDLPKTTALLKQIYGLIKYLIPVLVIGLSIVDFLKVLLSGEEKVYKDAWSKFVKRIIIGIVILLLPILLKIVINISGVLDDYNVDGDNIFCILS